MPVKDSYHTKCVHCAQSPQLWTMKQVSMFLTIIWTHCGVKPPDLVLQGFWQQHLQMVSCSLSFLCIVKENNEFLDWQVNSIAIIVFRDRRNEEIQIMVCIGGKWKCVNHKVDVGLIIWALKVNCIIRSQTECFTDIFEDSMWQHCWDGIDECCSINHET